jgi:hypothetical protein
MGPSAGGTKRAPTTLGVVPAPPAKRHARTLGVGGRDLQTTREQAIETAETW